MEPRNAIKLAVIDKINGVDVGPNYVPLSLLGDFQTDVATFLKGATREVDLTKVIVSIEPGSFAIVANGLLAASGLWGDIAALETSKSISQIDSKRAAVIVKWQAAAKKNPQRKYVLSDQYGAPVLTVSDQTDFQEDKNVWLRVEKYVLGKIVDMGGTLKPNIHIQVDGGRTITVAASQDQLAESEKNRMYRDELLHISAEENLLTGELQKMRLIAFESYKPKFDEAEFERMVERGTKVWSQVDDSWLEDLRNGDA